MMIEQTRQSVRGENSHPPENELQKFAVIREKFPDMVLQIPCSVEEGIRL
jgi:hypothetical protein